MTSLFLSHGAPTLAVEDSPAHRFLRSLGASLGVPRGIVVFSAHHIAPGTTVTAAERPATIHDFAGFPRALYDLRYPAPGDPALAAEIAGRLADGGMAVRADAARGLDHGAWVPLSLMYPEADVPVVQVSIDPRRGPRHHVELGRLLAPLADQDVLVIGSGGITHNLYELSWSEEAATPAWARDFAEWVGARVAEGDVDALVDYRQIAPSATRNHPTEEHFMPLLAALGAAGPAARGERLHTSFTLGALGMDMYRFGAAR